MTPIDFPEVNVRIAEDQDEYQTLPACFVDGVVVSCWRLTLWERLKVLFCGRFWFRQMTFGDPLQPQLPSVETPFIKGTT